VIPRAQKIKRKARTKDDEKQLPFNEAVNQLLLQEWREKQCIASYNKLFTNFAHIIDGVIGYFVQRGILYEGAHEDYKQEAFIRIIEILPEYTLGKGKLYSFVYASVTAHLRIIHWNQSRKSSRIEYEPEERTMEMLLGGKIYAPHIGLDLRNFIVTAVNRIRAQRFYNMHPKTAIKVKLYMFRTLCNRLEDRPIKKLQEKYRDIAKVRYRMLISDLLDEHFPDGKDSYHDLFRNFFK